MLGFFLLDGNLPFTVAISIVILLGLIELLSLVTGLSLSGLFDDLLSLDSDIDSDGATGFTGITGWLCLNRLPLLIWFVLASSSFAITGLAVNYLTAAITGGLLPSWLAIPVALIGLLLGCRYLGSSLARLLPKNESSVISIDSLEGAVGTVTLATASRGKPAEVVVKDESQQKHYVLAEPDSDDQLAKGTDVVLLRKDGNIWIAARFENSLSD
ncbi:YqiJ family protein [Shewanella submarina]|uniref:OB-fold-containig protein n=1 Tax=Shewanella submarina TaxID=2016376 RepID=A0ABV7G7F6_9GAMM|nr:OB-fold-containig protein [Shewanella submarina]MCL1037160.1 YqiJ family protein [Shewanella submarina]